MKSGLTGYGFFLPVFGFFLSLIAGCAENPGPEILRRAWDLGEEYHWEEAGGLARSYLLSHPGNAPAHFLLGRSFLHGAPPRLTLAEGELRTALRCFRDNRDLGPLAELHRENEFEAAIHRELARTEMRWMREAALKNMPAHILRPRVKRALEEVRKGRELDPACPVLADMETTLEQYIQLPGRSALPWSGEG